MAFYLRKSVSVGPLKFNLSKSGVGLSAGIKGMRVGSGPRGNYVHMGRHGVYYRAALPGATPSPAAQPRFSPAEADGMREIDSAAATQMKDASASDLLAEFETKQQITRWMPIALVLGFLAIAALLALKAEPLVILATVAATLAATWLSKARDDLRKTVVVLYELDAEPAASFQQLHDGFIDLGKCGGLWHVEAEGDVTDRKRNAGASSVIRRKSIRPTTQLPRFFKTNVEVQCLPAGRQTLCFMPDRLLVFERHGGVGAVPYDSLAVKRQPTRFIEEGSVPGDAKVVDRTWRYVNKKGGPDRRFSNNRELPVALYESMHLTSASGLNELLHLSRLDSGQLFEEAVVALAASRRQ